MRKTLEGRSPAQVTPAEVRVLATLILRGPLANDGMVVRTLRGFGAALLPALGYLYCRLDKDDRQSSYVYLGLLVSLPVTAATISEVGRLLPELGEFGTDRAVAWLQRAHLSGDARAIVPMRHHLKTAKKQVRMRLLLAVHGYGYRKTDFQRLAAEVGESDPDAEVRGLAREVTQSGR